MYNLQSWSKENNFLLKVRTSFKKTNNEGKKEESGDKGNQMHVRIHIYIFLVGRGSSFRPGWVLKRIPFQNTQFGSLWIRA